MTRRELVFQGKFVVRQVEYEYLWQAPVEAVIVVATVEGDFIEGGLVQGRERQLHGLVPPGVVVVVAGERHRRRRLFRFCPSLLACCLSYYLGVQLCLEQ